MKTMDCMSRETGEVAMNELKIGIIGAGKTGKHLIGLLASYDFVKIVKVAELDEGAPGYIYASEKGIPVTKDYLDVAGLGTEVDIVFEVTGKTEVKLGLRAAMQKSNNKHTVIVPELVAVLMMSMAKGEFVDSFHGFLKYE